MDNIVNIPSSMKPEDGRFGSGPSKIRPEQVDALGIVPGEDYCTLVTCTPYGINTHRLLVRGHRVENTPEAARMHVTADATQFDPLLVAPVLAIPVLLLLLMILLVPKRRRKSREDKNDT